MEGVLQTGFFEVVVALIFDVLVGVPPINPTSRVIPFGEGVDGSLKRSEVDVGFVNFREPAEQGSLVVPHVDGIVFWIDGFTDFFEDGFAFGADADDLLREFDGAGGIVGFGADHVVGGGVEVGFELEKILPVGAVEKRFFLLCCVFGHELFLPGYADAGHLPDIQGK